MSVAAEESPDGDLGALDGGGCIGHEKSLPGAAIGCVQKKMKNGLKYSIHSINFGLSLDLQEQGTGNREQGTGNREQGTGNREDSEQKKQKPRMVPGLLVYCNYLKYTAWRITSMPSIFNF
ncbi:MAG: hypothetical protein ACLQM6_07020 [Acidobacteriaceae bacterium]